MKVAQAYQQNSQSNVTNSGLGFSLATDLNRPGVFLSAQVKDGMSFARSMLVLHKVVNSNMIQAKRDYSKYQEWVQGEYLKELGKEIEERDLKGLIKQESDLQKQAALLRKDIRRISREASKLNSDFYKSREKFWQWLYNQDHEAWVVLDPVISVQEDGVIFEAFSIDESSYGRVTLPKEELILADEMHRGTTNIDFSKNLAEEFDRVRSYRPLDLSVGYKEVGFSTNTTSTVEKKIDLPDSWVNGFLEVQSASSMDKTSIEFSPSSISDLISVLERKKDNVSPKSIKFILEPGKRPIIEIEPWGIMITEYDHVFKGSQSQTIRIWGRKRLQILKDLLPYASETRVELLGTGLPSFWCVSTKNIKLDLGLSGWSANDWSSQTKFALLSHIHDVSEGDIQKVSNQLFQSNGLSAKDVANLTNLNNVTVNHALTKLCSRGQAMYDFHKDIFRWRELFPLEMISKEKVEPKIIKDAMKIINGGHLSITSRINDFFENKYTAEVTLPNKKEHQNTESRKHLLEVELDGDNNPKKMLCSCIEYQKTHLKKGACSHIVALLKEIYQELSPKNFGANHGK